MSSTNTYKNIHSQCLVCSCHTPPLGHLSGEFKPCTFKLPILSLALVMFIALVSLGLYLIFLTVVRLVASLEGLSLPSVLPTRLVSGGFSILCLVIFFIFLSGFVVRNVLHWMGNWPIATTYAWMDMVAKSLGRGIHIGCSPFGHSGVNKTGIPMSWYLGNQ